MRLFGVVIALIIVPASMIAQQGDDKKHTETVAPEQVDYHCEQNQMFYSFCKESEQKDRDAALRHAEQKEKAKQKTSEKNNWQKMRSPDRDEQIDGVGGEVKDLNSHGNSNGLSKEVTNKSLTLIEQMAHQEGKLLDDIGKSVERNFETPSGYHSPLSAEGHSLNESTRGEARPLSLEKQFQHQARDPGTSKEVHYPNASVDSGHQKSLRGSFERQEAQMLNMPSTVSTVSRAVQKIQAAEQQRIAAEQQRVAAELKEQQRVAAQRRAAAVQEPRSRQTSCPPVCVTK